MHGNLSRRGRNCTTRETIAENPRLWVRDVSAYIDTVELFFRFKPGLKRLRAIQSRKTVHREKCYGRDGNLYGWRLIVHQPTRQALLVLQEMQEGWRGKLRRVDLATDFITGSASECEQLKRWVINHSLLRWRRRQDQMHDEDGTVYWTQRVTRKRPAHRDLVVYADKPAKLTGELDCVHVELRLYDTYAVKRSGLSQVSQLPRLKPKALLRRHIKLAGVDRFTQKVTRKTVQAYRSRTSNPFIEAYQANIPQKVVHILHQGRAQNLHSRVPTATLDEVSFNVLPWPSVLEVPSLKSQDISKKSGERRG
jgi:hypothetical protein